MLRTALTLFILMFSITFSIQAQDKSYDKQVDALLRELGTRNIREKAITKFTALGTKAESRLLFHIKNRTRIWFLMSIDACRYIWTDKTRDACKTLVQDRDEKIATLAMAALMKNMTSKSLCEMCDPILHRMHFSCGGILFIFLQNSNPTKERLMRLMNNKSYWPSIAPYLCNYRGPKINKATRNLLAKGSNIVKVQALNGLIFQADTAEPVKKYVVKLFKSKSSNVRERVAEYMHWYGSENALKPLNRALAVEKDIYAKSSIKAAINAIAKRKQLYAKRETSEPQIAKAGKDFYKDAVLKLTNLKTTAQRESIINSIYKMTVQEPHYAYGSAKVIDQEVAKAQYKMFRLLAGYTPMELLNRHIDNIDVATPKKFFTVPPISDYLDPKRKSFGKLIPSNSGPFSGSHHVGDDCAWLESMKPVVAIADGLVRYVEHTVSWGGIVIVEHKMTDGTPFCSLYAHLDPLIIAKPGDTVKAGDKLASLGRSYSWENGGYGAHLHFGIHNSKFSNEWICGYISKKMFANREHQWIDPQDFIQKHLSKSITTSK